MGGSCGRYVKNEAVGLRQRILGKIIDADPFDYSLQIIPILTETIYADPMIR